MNVTLTAAEVDFAAPIGTVVGTHRFSLTPIAGGAAITLDSSSLDATFQNVPAADYHTSVITLDANSGAQIGPAGTGRDILASEFTTNVKIAGAITVALSA